MNKERIEEIAGEIFSKWVTGGAVGIAKVLSALPEFQEPRMTPCSERMPLSGEVVDFYDHIRKKMCVGFHKPDDSFPWRFLDGGLQTNGVKDDSVSHWQPRHVPAPPVEEDSECVRKLKALPGNYSGFVEEFRHKAIAIVKEFEKGGAK